MRLTKWMGTAALLLLAAACIWNSAVRSSVLTAGERCLTVLIPALYFYAVLTAFCVRSGGLRAVCGNKGLLWGIVLFSQVGGYPIGAQLLHETESMGELNASQKKRLLCVCFGCGPGFLLGTVCRGMPAGLTFWMMLSVILPNLLVSPFVLRGIHVCGKPRKHAPFLSAFTGAAESAADAMLKMTAMILAFAACMGIFEGMGVTEFLPPVPAQTMRSLLEISCVTELLSSGGTLPLAAACLSFGGICVHLQLAAIAGGVDWGRFYLTRTAAAVLSYGICYAGVKWLFSGVYPAFLQMPRTELTTGSILPGLCLLCMAVMLLREVHLVRASA